MIQADRDQLVARVLAIVAAGHPEFVALVERVAVDTVARLVGLSPGQVSAFEMFVLERARQLEAETWLAVHGSTLTLRTDKGDVAKVIEAPQLRVARTSGDRALAMARRIGLTAGSLAEIGRAPVVDDDEPSSDQAEIAGVSGTAVRRARSKRGRGG